MFFYLYFGMQPVVFGCQSEEIFFCCFQCFLVLSGVFSVFCRCTFFLVADAMFTNRICGIYLYC